MEFKRAIQSLRSARSILANPKSDIPYIDDESSNEYPIIRAPSFKVCTLDDIDDTQPHNGMKNYFICKPCLLIS